MFDFIKNLFLSPTPEQAQTPKDVRQAQMGAMTISNKSLKKDIGEDGLSIIISNVKYELYALYPDIRIDKNLLKVFCYNSLAFLLGVEAPGLLWDSALWWMRWL